jgi:hypothetical protein
LGFDNGSIIFTVADTGHVSNPQQLSPTGEAINGIAAVGEGSLAVSTRSEVSFFQASGPVGPARAVFPGGAHGVVATKSGSYVATLGPKGLLIVRPTEDHFQRMEVTKETEGKLYFYRAAALHDQCGKETLVFANRRDGVGLSVFNGNERRRVVHKMGFEGIDVIDVCAVAAGSLSAVAVSKKADLLWINDTSQNIEPVVIRPKHVEGAVYKVLATSRHLFVLTSKALYIWFDFVDRTLKSQFAMPDMVRLVLHINAIDMCLIGEQHLLLVMGVNAITSLAIADIEGQLVGQSAIEFRTGNNSGRFEKTSLGGVDQSWQIDDIEQADLVFA